MHKISTPKLSNMEKEAFKLVSKMLNINFKATIKNKQIINTNAGWLLLLRNSSTDFWPEKSIQYSKVKKLIETTVKNAQIKKSKCLKKSGYCQWAIEMGDFTCRLVLYFRTKKSLLAR